MRVMLQIAKKLCFLVGIIALIGCGGKQERVVKHLEKGENYLNAEEYEKARVEFKNVLQMDPHNLQATYALARVQEKLGNLRQAIALYQRVIEQNDQHVDAHLQLSKVSLLAGATEFAEKKANEVLLLDAANADAAVILAGAKAQHGQVDSAIREAKEVLDKSPKHRDALLLLIALYSHNKEYSKAVDLLENALAENPRDVVLLVLLADIYARSKNIKDAIGVMRDIVELQPQELAYRTRLTQFLISQGELDSAEDVLRKGVEIMPSNTQAKLALVDFLASRRSHAVALDQLKIYLTENDEDMELHFGLARLHQAIKEYEGAESVYRGIIAVQGLRPDGLRARTALAQLKAGQGETKPALELLSEVIAESPGDHPALLMRARLMIAENNPVAAIADLRVLLRDQPDSPIVRKLLAAAHVINNEAEQAAQHLDALIRLNPNDWEARKQLSDLLFEQGDLETAREHLDILLSQRPNDLKALESLFRVYQKNNDLDEALTVAENIKRNYPKEALGYYFSGLVFQKQEKFDESIREFKYAVAKAPKAVESLRALITSYLEKQQFDTAMAELDALLAVDDSNLVAHNLRGEILLLKEDFSGARAAFSKAISLNPKIASLYLNLATAYVRMGEEVDAINAFKQGLVNTDNNSILVNGLTELYEYLGQHDQAIEFYSDLQKQQPDLPFIANNLAMLLLEHRNDGASFERAIALVEPFKTSREPAYLDTLGWAYYKRGEYDAAISLFEQAITYAPTAEVLQYHLGMAHFQKGNQQLAKRALEKAVAGSANYRGVEEARTTLSHLTKNDAS